MEPALTVAGVSQLEDEAAYFILLRTQFQLVTQGAVEMCEDRTFGEVVDRYLHNFAATLYQMMSATRLSVDDVAGLVEAQLRSESSRSEEERARVLLHLKAWRYRRSEGGDF